MAEEIKEMFICDGCHRAVDKRKEGVFQNKLNGTVYNYCMDCSKKWPKVVPVLDKIDSKYRKLAKDERDKACEAIFNTPEHTYEVAMNQKLVNIDDVPASDGSARAQVQVKSSQGQINLSQLSQEQINGLLKQYGESLPQFTTKADVEAQKARDGAV